MSNKQDQELMLHIVQRVEKKLDTVCVLVSKHEKAYQRVKGMLLLISAIGGVVATAGAVWGWVLK